MGFQYKMVQIPPQITVSSKTAREQGVAANYLEGIVGQYATQGWEFYRVDTIGVTETPGCLAGLFGAKALNFEYYVVTFRKNA